MDRKEIVRKAIRFESPGRIPKFMFNGDLSRSDVVQIVLEKWYMGARKDETEWGFSWEKGDEDETSMGVPREYLLRDFGKYERYVRELAPDPHDPGRFQEARAFGKTDQYLMGSLYLSGFTVMTFLRGFENLLLDLYENPGIVEKLADLVFGFENEIIRQMPQYGFDGVALYDDWGMQKSMMISPELWRKFFKPRYADQAALAHSLDMDVFFHTCGQVTPIIEDLAGLFDILNLGQADINDMNYLKTHLNGRVCFCQPINYQTTAICGSKEEIFAEAREIRETFNSEKGGLIAMLFDYEGMGWKPENPRNTEYQIQAFSDEG